MKKEIFYLIGAVAGALLVLLAVPLGNAYIGNYLSVYGGMDTQSYVLLMQSAVTGFQILGGVLLGLFGAAYLFRRKPQATILFSNAPACSCTPGHFSSCSLGNFLPCAPWGISFHVLRGEFPSMCSVENFLPPLDKWIRQLYYSTVI